MHKEFWQRNVLKEAAWKAERERERWEDRNRMGRFGVVLIKFIWVQ